MVERNRIIITGAVIAISLIAGLTLPTIVPAIAAVNSHSVQLDVGHDKSTVTIYGWVKNTSEIVWQTDVVVVGVGNHTYSLNCSIPFEVIPRGTSKPSLANFSLTTPPGPGYTLMVFQIPRECQSNIQFTNG